MAQKYTKRDVLEEAERLKNWGRWGPDDEVGALNFIAPEDIVEARLHIDWKDEDRPVEITGLRELPRDTRLDFRAAQPKP